MKKQDLLKEDFLKQLKTGDQLNNFLADIQKRGIEKILEGELDSHLGYDKNKKARSENKRNGFNKKRIKTRCFKAVP